MQGHCAILTILSLTVLVVCKPEPTQLTTSSSRVIETSDDLVEQLCNSTNKKDVRLILDSTKTYNISRLRGFSCIINNAAIVITSNTANHAIIKCPGTMEIDQEIISRAGFAFVNSTVTINRVDIHLCGAYLNTLPNETISMFNESSLYYNTDFASVLVFVHCKVTMQHLEIQPLFGFDAIGINLDETIITDIYMSSRFSFENSILHRNKTFGSGLLFHYLDNSYSGNSTQSAKQMKICDSHLQWVEMSTANCQPEGGCCLEDIYSGHKTRKPILTSAVLTILYNNRQFPANVNLENLTIENNFVQFFSPAPATSLLILHYHANEHDKTNITNCELKTLQIYNKAVVCFKSAEFAFHFYPSSDEEHDYDVSYKPLYISDTLLRSQPHGNSSLVVHDSLKNGIYIGVHEYIANITVSITLTRVTIMHNYASGQGTILNVYTEKILTNLTMNSVVLHDNRIKMGSQIESDIGLISLMGQIQCIINGTSKKPSRFYNNNGVVIHAANDTKLFLHGHVVFKSNSGINGAAINLRGSSRLNFMHKSTILFEDNNSVGLGGAIYAKLSTTKQQQQQGYHRCSICFHDETTPDDPHSFDVTFRGNSALLGGSDIYAYPIFNCSNEKHSQNQASPATYKQRFHFETSKQTFQISTVPSTLVLVNKPNSAVYPGQTIQTCIAVKDEQHRNVFGTIKKKLLPEFDGGDNLVKEWMFLEKDFIHVIQENESCTNVTATVKIHPSDADIGKPRKILYYLTDDAHQNDDINIKVKSCPMGFQLNENTGACVCAPVLHRLGMGCSIQTQTFNKLSQTNSWVGKLISPQNGSHDQIGVSLSCPIGHCTTDSKLNWFYADGSGLDHVYLREKPTSSQNQQLMCVNGRGGPLCSKCSKGLTEAYGSFKCRKCDHHMYYWLHILLFLSFGPLMILFLYSFRLTLTAGTINGILFYANFINTGLLETLYDQSNSHTEFIFKDIALVFLSTLNLRYGFPVCFFRSLSVYVKAASGTVFSYYLFGLVGVIILISRWSSWVSKHTSHSSVQVLVTVIHLSFSSLILNVVLVFSWTTIYTNDGSHKVWTYDGTAPYFTDPRHLKLVLFSSISVFPVLFFYVIFLSVTKQFLKCGSSKCNLYFRPLYEAIHAPYKEGKEYWFLIRLIVLISATILWSWLPTPEYSKLINIMSAILVCMLLVAQGIFNPYKSQKIALLDSWALLNLLVVYVGLLLPQKNLEKKTMILIITTLLMLVTFIGVVLYHFVQTFGIRLMKKFHKRFPSICNSCYRNRRPSRMSNDFLIVSSTENHTSSTEIAASNKRQQQVTSSDFYSTYDGYREPLLDDYDST